MTKIFHNQIIHRISRFISLPFIEKYLFLEAVFLMGFIRLVILAVPFRRIAPFLGEHMKETPDKQDEGKNRILMLRISGAISRAERSVPWEAKCLVQAITGKIMIRRRDMESTLYLGLIKRPDLAELEAHAWLRCGSFIICGGKELERYTIVAIFGRTINRPA